jgi:hypothetical protein
LINNQKERRALRRALRGEKGSEERRASWRALRGEKGFKESSPRREWLQGELSVERRASRRALRGERSDVFCLIRGIVANGIAIVGAARARIHLYTH